MTLEKVYDELISMIEDLRSGQRLADSAIADLQKETQGAQRSTGNPIVIDAAPVNAKALTVTLEPKQTGSGDPSPDNVRPISGYTGCVVTTADAATDPTITNSATIQFGQTVYGGSVDFTDGGIDDEWVLVDFGDLTWINYKTGGYSTEGLKSYIKKPTSTAVVADCISECYKIMPANATLRNGEMSVDTSGTVYVVNTDYPSSASDFKTAMTGLKICYEKATPDTISTQPTDLKLLKGTNNISVDGNAVIDITYQPNNVLGQILAESEAYADSVVTITPALESGTKLADYTISGTAGIIYGPGETQATRKTTTKKSTKEE